MGNNRIRVVGYAQRQFFENGIEYRNFTPDLVGLQTTSDTDIPLFTSGNFYITTNMAPKSSKVYNTNKFTNFVTLTDLDLTLERAQSLLYSNSGVILKLDKTKIETYALFGSFTEYVRITLENIITKWPAALFVYPIIQSNTNTQTGFTVENYIYDTLTDTSTFKIKNNVIINKFKLNYFYDGTTLNTFNEGSDIRNLITNYNSYCILYNGNESDILGFTGSTISTNSYIFLKVKGDVFAGGSNIGFFVRYHIKPNKLIEEQFFNSLPNLESYLLNRLTIPRYTSKYSFPIKTDSGLILHINESITWPTTDGYNIDFDSENYSEYVTKLLKISQDTDLNSTNLIERFLVSESITEFDTSPVFLPELDRDTSGQKVNKLLHIYGREFDDINNYIQGISFANVVTYDQNNNTPDIYLKNLAKVLGWELVSSILENSLLTSYVTTAPSTYSGQSVGLTPIQADIELWRRLILNTPWLWKSKGTRKGIEFLFKFIGSPSGLISFNEYVYIADGAIDVDLFLNILKLNNLNTDLSNYAIDNDGFPRPLPENGNVYFQGNGLWYRETGGTGATIDILTGNNPHLGPYDRGNKYLSQFRELIPNFSPTTVSSTTETITTTKLFTNYNFGTFNNLGVQYDGGFYNSYVNSCGVLQPLIETIIKDPKPQRLINECNCESIADDFALNIHINRPTNQLCYEQHGVYSSIVLQPKINDGVLFNTQSGSTYNLNISFDYLFKYECSYLEELIYPQIGVYTATTPVTVFENNGIKLKLLVQSGATYVDILEKQIYNPIGTNNLYNYITGTTNTGIYIPNLALDVLPDINGCAIVKGNIIQQLFIESGLSGTTNGWETFANSLPKNGLNSEWLHADVMVTDAAIIELIKNKKIKFSLELQYFDATIDLMVDNIQMNRIENTPENTNIYIQSSPGFNLTKVIDNKKSWIKETTQRDFEILRFDKTNPIRKTNYLVDNERLILNSKEIDLNLNIASAIETDVWCYMHENPCVLTGITCFPNLVETMVETIVETIVEEEEIIIVTGYTITTGLPLILVCPSGYILTPAQDNCIKLLTTGATLNGYGPAIKAGSKDAAYSNTGTFFFPNIQNYNSLPFNGVPSSYDLINPTGGTISALNISSPINTFWDSNSSSTGRLNNVGISASTNEWLGFTACFNIIDSGTYYIGLAADNECRFYVDNIKYVELTGGNAPNAPNFSVWHVFPFELTSGFHIIQMEGRNIGVGSNSSFGAEIYNPVDYATLTGATSTGQTGILFSTFNKIGDYYDIGTSIGYSCPSGYSLDKCNGNVCTKILSTELTTGYTSYTSITSTTEVIIVSSTTTTTTVTATTISCSGCTDLCGDKIPFDTLLSEPIYNTNNSNEFIKIISSELIDVKNRQTINSYPTLRALYNRYLSNSNSCSDKNNNGYNYQTIQGFIDLVGDYWVDLIEQVIPATTLWGSTKIYTNTIFDNQKYRYKPYTLLLGGNPYSGTKVLSSIDGVLTGTSVEITMVNTDGIPLNAQVAKIYIAQMNSSPEYIGMVRTTTTSCKDKNNDDSVVVINECSLVGVITTKNTGFDGSGGSASVEVSNSTGNLSYLWSNGATTETISNLTNGEYSVTVTDANCCTFYGETTIINTEFTSCQYSQVERVEWLNSMIIPEFILTVPSMTVNNVELVSTLITYSLIPPVNVFINNTINNFNEVVDWLNTVVFPTLGVDNFYRAQMAFALPSANGDSSQFYIIHPTNDIFVLSIVNNENYGFLYKNNSITLIGEDYINEIFDNNQNYYGIVCNPITIIDGVVIE